MTSLLVLHDLGTAGGAPWQAAFGSWPGPVSAPDLPGHGTAPPPPGGHYELGDAVFAVADLLPAPDDPQPVVVGVGRSGHAARVLAVAGRAAALVLVNGLGGPWQDVEQRNASLRDLRRQILATPSALAAPVSTPDPRASLVLGPSHRDHVVAMCEAAAVPTLVIETPASPTPDAPAVVRAFPDAELVRTGSEQAAPVADAVLRWWAARSG